MGAGHPHHLRPPRHQYGGLRAAQAVVCQTAVVAEVRYLEVVEEETVSLPVSLHLAVVTGVQQHGVLVPPQTGPGLGPHTAGQLEPHCVVGRVETPLYGDLRGVEDGQTDVGPGLTAHPVVSHTDVQPAVLPLDGTQHHGRPRRHRGPGGQHRVLFPPGDGGLRVTTGLALQCQRGSLPAHQDNIRRRQRSEHLII